MDKREIHFTLHDYNSNTIQGRAKGKYFEKFLTIHEKEGKMYYIDTLRMLIDNWEKARNEKKRNNSGV